MRYVMQLPVPDAFTGKNSKIQFLSRTLIDILAQSSCTVQANRENIESLHKQSKIFRFDYNNGVHRKAGKVQCKHWLKTRAIAGIVAYANWVMYKTQKRKKQSPEYLYKHRHDFKHIYARFYTWSKIL